MVTRILIDETGTKTFRQWALDFLNAVSLSNAAFPRLLKGEILRRESFEERDFWELWKEFSPVADKNKWKNYFTFDPISKPTTEICWTCGNPHAATVERDGKPGPIKCTRIFLEKDTADKWQIRVEARDPKTADNRISKASGKSAESVPGRILAAQHYQG